MPWDLTEDKSTLVQVMAWCRQATSHYLSQCWPDPCHHMASLDHDELKVTSWALGQSHKYNNSGEAKPSTTNHAVYIIHTRDAQKFSS